MIGKIQSIGSDQTISVSGLLSEGWDDCLATVSVGEDVIASRVLATDTYFFVLVSGSGTIIFWHFETCEEARRIHHGEYVPHMALNRSGSLLATADICTYRVWDFSSGQELHRFPKATASITMAIAFGNSDSELVVGLDDCSITGFDLNSREELWYFSAMDPYEDFHGCPRLMRFSPDLTKLWWHGEVDHFLYGTWPRLSTSSPNDVG
jgi:WD40 repeat protein